MKKRVNLLKIVIILTMIFFLLVTGLFTFLVITAKHKAELSGHGILLSMVVLYLIDILVANSVINGFGLLKLVREDQLITVTAGNKLTKITRNSLVILLFSFGFLPMFYSFAQLSDAPGLMIIGCLFICIFFAIFSVSWFFDGLLQKSIRGIK
ncbi:hypothetical protein Q2T76_01740 [Lactobacillus sp. YT155]|uniref:DUF2975 domain-containing protein n=1 Tax=Lactobacillus sp. YT155 TaxID=3060955 RepID=UPI00265E4021|nr:DUF2975 domain-containing protein [Lactobacillus sp. YT155]MDO1604774.1 hypothetical protein [Lactobacillus sp. YT155]